MLELVCLLRQAIEGHLVDPDVELSGHPIQTDRYFGWRELHALFLQYSRSVVGGYPVTFHGQGSCFSGTNFCR